MEKPLVSIIIANLNGANHLRWLLPSIKREKYRNKEIIIIDNGSSDESIDLIQKIYPRAKIIKNKLNLGFVGANIQGIKIAKGKYILLLNNDTYVSNNLIEPLVNLMESDSNIGACQPRVLRMEEKRKLDSVGSYFTSTGFLYHFGYGSPDVQRLKIKAPLFSAKGCALFLRKSLIDEIGFLDKDYFAYFEETDLCWRIWMSKHTIVYCPETYVLHKGWGTASSMDFSFINFHSYKNRIATLIKNLELKNLLIVLPINILFSIIAAFAYLLSGKIGLFFSIWRAFAWVFANFDVIIKKRQRVQKLRKIHDSEFLPKLTQKVDLLYFYYLFVGLEKYNTTADNTPFFK